MSASGEHEAEELIASEPGLERVVSALAADGDATELVGRQAALTMFRTVRGGQGGPAFGSAVPATTLPPTTVAAKTAAGTPDAATGRAPRVPRRSRATRGPRSARSPRSPRVPGSSPLSRFPALVAAAAVLVAVGAAATAAAYAAALPGPVQQIAHSVFAPLGIPTAPPPAPQSPGPGSGPAAGGPSGAGGGPASTGSVAPSGSARPGASGSPATPSPSASRAASASGSPTASPSGGTPSPVPVALTVTAAATQVAAGGQDTFTAYLTQAGQPVGQAGVQLLEHDAGSPAARVAATGVTDASGTVTLTASGLRVNAIFRVAGTGSFTTATSAKITVQVIPTLVVRFATATALAVRALAPAAPGDVVVLQELSGGVWIDAASRKLGLEARATFPVVSGQTYRVVLRATLTHGRAVSAAVTVA